MNKCFIYFDISKKDLINEIYIKTLQRVTGNKSEINGINDNDFDDIVKNNCYVYTYMEYQLILIFLLFL